VIDVGGVDYIDVADSRVYPKDKSVKIDKNADMHDLLDAKIMTDTVNKYHNLYDVTVDVRGKFNMLGKGTIDYLNATGKKQQLFMDSIVVREMTDGTHRTIGFGKVSEEKGFVLNPRIMFKGDVILKSEQKPFTYDGYALIDQVSPRVKTNWFSITEDVKPDSLYLPITDSMTVNESRNRVYAGIHLARENTEPYPTVLYGKRSVSDDDLFTATGILHVDPATKAFNVGRRSKILEGDLAGPLFQYNDQTEQIYCEGPVTFNLDINLVDFKAGGMIKHDIKDTVFEFSVMLAITFPVPMDIMETMAYDVIELSAKRPSPYYLDPIMQRRIAIFNDDEKATEKNFKEITRIGSFKKKGSDKYSILISEVNLTWDQTTKSYKSKGPITLAYIGSKGIHKKIEGYLELGERGLRDFFKFYIKAGSEDWYYFQYQNNILSILSTYEKFNNSLRELDIEKRKTKSEDNKLFVFQLGGSKRQANGFVDAMKQFAEGPAPNTGPKTPKEDTPPEEGNPNEEAVPEEGEPEEDGDKPAPQESSDDE
jgi:hypothetical protein